MWLQAGTFPTAATFLDPMLTSSTLQTAMATMAGGLCVTVERMNLQVTQLLECAYALSPSLPMTSHPHA